MPSAKHIWKLSLLLVLPSLGFISWLELASVQAGFITTTQVFSAGYFGGNSNEVITGVAHSPDGTFVVVGRSENPGWRNGKAFGSVGVCSSTNAGGFVARFSPDGRSLIWYSYFNCGIAVPHKVALDSNNNIYLAGIARPGFSQLISTTFATTISGPSDPFVAKLSPDGLNLVWGSYQPGEGELEAVHLALTNQNEPLISGRQESSNGLTGPIFLARFDSDGKNRVAYTTINDVQNSTAPTYISGLAARPDGLVYPVGYFQREVGLQVPFLISFNSGLSTMPEVWRNYASPVPADLRANSHGQAVSIDGLGNVIAAFTAEGNNSILTRDPQNPAVNLTVLNGAYQSSHGLPNGIDPIDPSSFVARYSFASGAILDATFFHATLGNGRTSTTKVYGLTTDNQNRVYLTGETACCLPLTEKALDQIYSGGEGFLALLNPEMSQLGYATYLGGANKDTLNALSFGAGRLALGGYTLSGDLPVLAALQNTTGGGQDGLVAVFAPPYDLQFGLVNPAPQTVGVNHSSQPITLKLYDRLTGAAVSYLPTALGLTLSSNSPSGRFDSSPNGSFSQATFNTSLAAGSTYLSFYYRDSSSGPKTITISPANGMAMVSYNLTFVAIGMDNTENSVYNFKANRLGAPPSQSLQANLKMLPLGSSSYTLTSLTYSPGAANWLTVQNNSGALPGALTFVPNSVPPVGTYTATLHFADSVYSTTTSLDVTYSVAEVKLSIVSGLQTIGAGYDSGAVVVEIGDSQTGNPVTLADSAVQLNLGSTSGNGSFRAPDGANVASVTIAQGSYRTFFVYRDSSPGNPVLQVAATGFASVSQHITIVAPSSCTNLEPTRVNSTADSSNDPCQLTLRAALANVAGLPENQREITFIPGLGTVILSATLGSLPAGTNLTGGCSLQNKPLVWLDTGLVPSGNQALLAAGMNNKLRGLAVYGYAGTTVQIASGKNLALGCFQSGSPDGQRFYKSKNALRIEPGGRLDILPEKNVRLY